MSIRVQINVSKELCESYDEMGKKIGVSRSSLMAIALKEYLDQKQAIEIMPELMKKYEELEKELKRKNEDERKED